jgi:hypothetical protein
MEMGTMTTKTDLPLPSILGAALLLTAAAVACGGSTGSFSGGESHFLAYCSDTCDGEFDCISGVCTKSCLLDGSSCDHLGDGVLCTDQSIEPGEVAVCDLACERDVDCSGLGDGYSCDSGFCRHDPGGGSAISSGGSSSGGSGGTAGSGGSAAGSGGGGATGSGGGGAADACEVLFMEFQHGETGIPDPLGCGTCECSNGTLSCTDEACAEGGQQVFECPLVDGEMVAPRSDSIDVLGSRFEGNTLVLEVGHSGGCADHQYGLCYMGSFLESFPVQGGLALIHDSHGDNCEAYLQTELRFDVTRYAAYYNELYQSNGGEIVTPYGNYVFGELDCSSRSNRSEEQLAQALDMVGLDCAADGDCVWFEIDTGCSPTPICSNIVGLGHETLDAVVTHLSETFCADFEADGCVRDALPRECPGPNTAALACENGQCVLAE